jgi:hypothetical protein
MQKDKLFAGIGELIVPFATRHLSDRLRWA